MFDGPLVVLVRKNRPVWQAGKLNGIGGHIEFGETPEQAMQREFFEETGHLTTDREWHKFAELLDPSDTWIVHFFVTKGDTSHLFTTTDEDIVVVDSRDVTAENAISNLTWLLPMARQFLADGKHVYGILENSFLPMEVVHQ